jgi:hypothetical protein
MINYACFTVLHYFIVTYCTPTYIQTFPKMLQLKCGYCCAATPGADPTCNRLFVM